MLLARLFTPEQFGVVALVQVFFTFGLMIAESGLGPAIINTRDMANRERDGVFTVTLVLGLLFAWALWAAGPAIAAFYGEDQVVKATPPLAIALFLSGASIVPLAIMNRSRKFIRLGIIDASAEIVGVIAAAAMLLTASLDPIIALSMRFPIRAGVKWIGLICSSASTDLGRPKPGRDIHAVLPLLSFATYQLGFSFVNFFSRNLDNLLVGRILGVATLGIYEKTYQLMRYPLMLLTFAMAPAVQPVMRFLADEPARASEIHVEFARTLAYLGVLAGTAVVLGADLIVGLLLGSQWVEVAPILRVLGLAVPAQVVLSSSGGFFQAMGNTRMLFVSGLLSAVLMISAIVVGVATGDLINLAWALVVAFHLNFIQGYLLLHRFVFRVPSGTFFTRMLLPGALVMLLGFVVAASAHAIEPM